jgi:hypothetical protein
MIGLLAVVAANLLYLAGLSQILDPVMSMEPFYIDMAQRPAAAIFRTDPAWGPLYALWLRPFRALLDEPIAVYIANLYGLSFAVSILIYLYVLLLTRRAAAAVFTALFFLISDLNVPLASKVCGFAFMIVLAGLTLSELVPAGARRTTVVGVGALFAAYARPEMYPAALCLWLAAAWLARSELGDSGRRVLVWPAAGLAVILLLLFFSGAPVLGPDGEGGRFLAAFREHFAWNWTRWNDQGGYFASIWAREFGGAETLLQAFRNNPGAVMHHLFDNLLGTMRFMIGSAFDHYPVFAPATWPALVRAENLVVTAAALGSVTLVVVRPALRRQMFDRYGHVFLPYAVLAAFPLGTATVIFPKAHYLVVPAVLLLLAAALAATILVPAWNVQFPGARPLALLACLAAVPRPFVLPSAYVVAGSPFKGDVAVSRPMTDTIELIRSLRLPPPVHVLTFTDGIGAMLGTSFHEVKVWRKGEQTLEAYMRDNDVGVIVTMEPGRESFLVDDPYWEFIQTVPEEAGFTRVPVPKHEAVRVYVRTDLPRADGQR